MGLLDNVIIVEPPTKEAIIRKKNCIFLSISNDGIERQKIKIYIGVNILKKIGFQYKSKARFGYDKNDTKKWYLILSEYHGYTLSKSNPIKQCKDIKNKDEKNNAKDILSYTIQLATPFENIKSIRKKEVLMDYVEFLKDKELSFLTFSVSDLINESLVERAKE